MNRLVLPNTHDPVLLQQWIATRSPAEKAALDKLLYTSDMFKSTYRYDPVAWAYDCIEWPEGRQLYSYQEDIMNALVEHGRVAARGTRGLGKTAVLSILVHWFICTRDEENFKIPTIAENWTQLKKYLWPEIHLWASRLRWDVMGVKPYIPNKELQVTAIKRRLGEALAVTSNKHGRTEGAHAANMLYVFDESKLIPDGIFDSAEGAMSNAFAHGYEAYAITVSSPGAPAGRFYDIHDRKPGLENWYPIHVTIEDCIREGAVPEEWPKQMAHLWGGTDSPRYRNDVLGEFAEENTDGVISIAAVERAMKRGEQRKVEAKIATEKQGPTSLGFDVSDGGRDQSVVAWKIDDPRYYGIGRIDRMDETPDSMKSTGHVVGITNKFPNVWVIVDANAVGGPVAKRLREQQKNVVSFVAQHKSYKRTKDGLYGFADKRSEAWWKMRERLDILEGEDVCLPYNNDLLAELIAPKFTIQSNGKIRVESKQEIRRRLGRSTDLADAVIMAFEDPFDRVQRQKKFGAPVLGMKRGQR